MIRSDDPFKRIPPASFQPTAQPAAGAGKQPEAPAAASGAAAPASPAPATGQTDTKHVRDIGAQDHPKGFDPEQGLTFPGSKPSGTTEKPKISLVNSLLDQDDIDINAPDFNDLGPDTDSAVFYWQAAHDASRSGDHKMAGELLAWAREFDPGAPDLPQRV